MFAKSSIKLAKFRLKRTLWLVNYILKYEALPTHKSLSKQAASVWSAPRMTNLNPRENLNEEIFRQQSHRKKKKQSGKNDPSYSVSEPSVMVQIWIYHTLLCAVG